MQSGLLMTLKNMVFEKDVGKGENIRNQQFLLFTQCFLPFRNQISIHFYLFSADFSISIGL